MQPIVEEDSPEYVCTERVKTLFLYLVIDLLDLHRPVSLPAQHGRSDGGGADGCESGDDESRHPRLPPSIGQRDSGRCQAEDCLGVDDVMILLQLLIDLLTLALLVCGVRTSFDRWFSVVHWFQLKIECDR